MSTLYLLVTIHHKQQVTLGKILPPLIFLLLFVSLHYFPVLKLASRYQVPISIGFSGLMFASPILIAIVVVAFMMLVNQLPFDNALQGIILTKVGSRTWIWSQIIYVAWVSLLFCLSLWLMSLVFLIGRTDFTNTWGPLLRSISQGLIAYEDGLGVAIDPLYLQGVTPWEAVLRAYSILYFLCLLIGWLTLLGNMILPSLGTVLSALLVILNLFFNIQSGIWVQYVSPLSWLNPYLVRFDQVSGLLTYSQVIGRLVCVLALLILGFVGMFQLRGGSYYGKAHR